VTVPLIPFAARASDRVLRLSRLRLADSVRFVRFNMDRALHVRQVLAGWEKGDDGVRRRGLRRAS